MSRNTLRAVAIKLDRLFAHVHVHTEELMGEQPRQRIVRTTSKLAVCTYDERKKTGERNHSRRRRGERERVCVCVWERVQYQSRVERDFAEYVIMNTSFSFTICSLLHKIF